MVKCIRIDSEKKSLTILESSRKSKDYFAYTKLQKNSLSIKAQSHAHKAWQSCAQTCVRIVAHARKNTCALFTILHTARNDYLNLLIEKKKYNY